MLSALFLFRYGGTWAPWRRSGNFDDGGKEEKMELSSNEVINRLSGCSVVTSGDTSYLEATTTTGRTWAPHGGHEPAGGYTILRSSPDADNLNLRFISGDQTKNKIILRFHWEATPSMV